MDVARCIELHNRLVRHATETLGRKCSAKTTRNWFTFHSKADAEGQRQSLPGEVVKFLENIDVVDSNLLSFNPFLRGIAPPGALRGGSKNEQKETWRKQFGQKPYILLYQAVDKDDTRGLVMNTEDFNCYYVNGVETDLDPNWAWQPLDTVLQRWWRLVECGKYTVDSSPESLDNDSEYGAVGWTMQPYISADVDEAVLAWDGYLSMIIRKMPDEIRRELPVTSTVGWLEEEDLNSNEISGFVREFLTKARRPPPEVKRIAPGLRILDKDLLKRFSVTLKRRKEDCEWMDPMDMPFPLCPSTERFSETNLAAALEGLDFLRTQFLFDDLAGLYMRPSAEALYTDTVAVISPYPNATYDGSTFELKYRLFEYQGQSACPWQPPHDVRLVSVLNRWAEFIKSDFWKVGSEGVEGGSEAWQQFSEQKNLDRLRLGEICH